MVAWARVIAACCCLNSLNDYFPEAVTVSGFQSSDLAKRVQLHLSCPRLVASKDSGASLWKEWGLSSSKAHHRRPSLLCASMRVASTLTDHSAADLCLSGGDHLHMRWIEQLPSFYSLMGPHRGNRLRSFSSWKHPWRVTFWKLSTSLRLLTQFVSQLLDWATPRFAIVVRSASFGVLDYSR